MSDSTPQPNDSHESPDALAHFDQRSGDWDELYSRPQFKDRLRLFVKSVASHVAPGGRILDYGCGTGKIAVELAKAGYHVLGIDGAQGMIEEASKTASSLGLRNIEFAHLADPEAWEPSDTYDAVVCSSVIEYVSDDRKLAGKLATAVAAGGWLFISIPSRMSLVGKLEDLVGHIKGRNRDVLFANRRYSRKEFGGLLSTMQLETRKVISFEFPVLGSIGVLLSRIPFVGVMSLVIARKN